MSSVLNLTASKKVEGAGELKRNTKGSDGKERVIDFWADVLNLDSEKMEGVLQLAKTDQHYDLTAFIRDIEYQGFDRLFYIKHCLARMSVSLFARFAVLGAIRGSNFARIKETCERVPDDMTLAFSSLGFVKTPKKRDHITILRCTASIPHWCAYYMLKAGVTHKLNMACPAPIQFPGAASLPMSKEVRILHIKFCIAFSSVLPGGSFSMSIYATAMANLIPVSDIPQEVLAILKVASETESYALTEDEKKEFAGQLVLKK